MYHVTIHAAIVTPESAEHGDVDRYEPGEPEAFETLEDVARELQSHGCTEAEGSRWFYSTEPVEDRSYFELGEARTFTAHVTRRGVPLRDLPHHHAALVRLLEA